MCGRKVLGITARTQLFSIEGLQGTLERQIKGIARTVLESAALSRKALEARHTLEQIGSCLITSAEKRDAAQDRRA